MYKNFNFILFILFVSLSCAIAQSFKNNECGGIIDESDGLLVYSYNTPFPKEQCLWTLTAQNGSGIEVSLLAHGFTSEDYYDALTLFYVHKNGSIIFSGSLNANRLDPIYIPSRVAFLSFAHYYTNNATGFVAQIKRIPSSKNGQNVQNMGKIAQNEQDNLYVKDTGRFHFDLNDSANKSVSYPPGGDSWDFEPFSEYATFVIQNRNNSNSVNGTGIKVVIDRVQMLGKCQNDALTLFTIRDTGYVFSWPQIARICSSGPIYELTLRPGHSLLGIFTSNSDYQYDNNLFRLSWS